MRQPSSPQNWNLPLFGDGDGEDDLAVGFPSFGNGGDAALLDAGQGLGYVFQKVSHVGFVGLFRRGGLMDPADQNCRSNGS